MLMNTNRSWNLLILVAVLIIDLTSFTCILPLFPSILEFYAQKTIQLVGNSNDTANGGQDLIYKHFQNGVKNLQYIIGVPNLERYNNVFFGGILGSLFSTLQYLSSPILGALSDVHGRKPILFLSICGSLISYYLWSIADTFGLFILSRIIGGLSKASVSIAIAIVTDLFPSELRGQGMAFVGVSFSVAFILGPIIGAYFAVRTRLATNVINFNSAPAEFAIYLTILELFLVFFMLPETLTTPTLKLPEILTSVKNYVVPWRLFNFSVLTKNIGIDERQTKNKFNAGDLHRLRSYGRLYFVFLFLFSSLEFTLCFLTHVRFNYDGMQQGRLYLFSGVIMILIQGGYVRRIPLAKQERSVLLGLCAIIPSYFFVSISFNQTLLYVGLFLYAIASALVVPSLTTLISYHCEETKKGICMGVFRSIGALARACGPIFGSFMFWLLGPMYCYMFGALLLFIPVVMLQSIKGRSCNNNEHTNLIANKLKAN